MAAVTDEPVAIRVSAWWDWKRINSGRPRGYAHPGETPTQRISDETALEVDRAVAQLKQDQPNMEWALRTYLRCGENLADTARRLHCSTNTARLYVQNAMHWVAGWLERGNRR